MATKLSDLLGTTYVGTAGPAGTIQVGTVTSNPGATTVTNVGTEKAAILNFNITPGDFDWPSTGIAVSTGSSWDISLDIPTGNLVGTTATQTLTNKTLTDPTIFGAITFSDSSTQSSAGATTGKAIAMAIVFG